MDPVDGTKGFIRGDQYAIALALIEDGQVVVGVLGCPNLPWENVLQRHGGGLLFASRRGGGASAVHLDRGDRGRFRLPRPRMQRRSLSANPSNPDTRRMAVRRGSQRPLASTCPRCGWTASASTASWPGEAGIYLRLPSPGSTYEEKIWDHAAGYRVIVEAGGMVTDIDGRELDFTRGCTLGQPGIVATNGRIHGAVVEAVRAVMRDEA